MAHRDHDGTQGPEVTPTRQTETHEPRVVQVDGWPGEWDVVPGDLGTGAFRIDAEGQWYHDGIAISHPQLLQTLAPHVSRTTDGAHVLRWGPHDHPVAVADTAAVIARIDPPTTGGHFQARLVDGRTLSLALDSLAVGAHNVLYAKMPHGDWVRFSRPAYYHIAEYIRDSRGGFEAVVGDGRWPVGRRE